MVVHLIYKQISALLSQTSFKQIISIALLHSAITYFAYVISNDAHITENIGKFIYFYVVVGSTVGFGDIAPQSTAGMVFMAIGHIPPAILIFTTLITLIGLKISNIRRAILMGHVDFSNLNNHIIILGYIAEQTDEIVSQILDDQNREPRPILIVTDQAIENPFSKIPMTHFCHVKNYFDDAEKIRYSAQNAHKMIIFTGNEDLNFTATAHFLQVTSEDCRITTHIEDKNKAQTLRIMSNRVEVNTPALASQLVRSMQDPGTSELFYQLMTNGIGSTMYRAEIFERTGADGESSISDIFTNASTDLLSKHGAILISTTQKNDPKVVLKPDLDKKISTGDYIYYLSEKRIKQRLVI